MQSSRISSGGTTRGDARALAAVGALLAFASFGADAHAQGGPPDAISQRAQLCARLEAQLAAFDNGQADGNGEQVRRFEEAAARQQAELDRTVAQSRRLGCESSGFFLFGSGQAPQCDQLQSQIQRMRDNLDRILAGQQRLQGSGDRDEQRRSIRLALAQYECGPQYRIAAPPSRPRGLFDTLFGGQVAPSGPPGPPGMGLSVPSEVTQSGTFRTLCVRTCDGFYFPISYSTVSTRFRDDERTCQRMCPAAEVALYSHRNPGEDVSQAVSLQGRPYSELPNAFRYRQQNDATCGCKRPGESWAAALGEDTAVERGDILVTEETAKTLSQPKPEPQAKPTRQAPPRTQTTPAAAPAPPRAAPPRSAAAPPPAGAPGEAPRAVGPQFIPAR